MDKKIRKIKKEINLESLSIDEIREKLGGTKVHAIAVQKGGTGKTTTSSDIAYTLAKKGFKVLLIDSDPQASLSALCNVDTISDEVAGLQDIYQYAIDNRDIDLEDIKSIWLDHKPVYVKPARDNGRFTNKEVEFGFDLIPANINLANYDILLSQVAGGVLKLFSVIDVIKDEMDYDFVIIDTCPGLSTIAYSAIMAAVDGVIVPVNLEPMTIKGAENLISVTTEIQHMLFDRFEIVHKGIAGIIKNQYMPRLKIQQRFSNIVETFFPIPCFEASIPNKTSCDTAHDLGRLYAEYDAKVGLIYDELVNEIIALDIYRAPETEPVYVEEFGEEIWNMINENKGKGDE